MKHLKTIIIVVLVFTNIVFMLYAFDKYTTAEQYKMEAETNFREVSKHQQIADSASYTAHLQSMKAKDIQKSYDSLLRVCK